MTLDKPLPNFPELKRLNLWVQDQDKIEPGERSWEQSQWITLREEKPACKTAFCVAGAAIVRAGHKLTGTGWNLFVDDKEVDDVDIALLADEALGINMHDGVDEKDDLYVATNTAADIDRIIRATFAEHDVSYARTKAAPDCKIQIIDTPNSE